MNRRDNCMSLQFLSTRCDTPHKLSLWVSQTLYLTELYGSSSLSMGTSPTHFTLSPLICLGETWTEKGGTYISRHVPTAYTNSVKDDIKVCRATLDWSGRNKMSSEKERWMLPDMVLICPPSRLHNLFFSRSTCEPLVGT